MSFGSSPFGARPFGAVPVAASGGGGVPTLSLPTVFNITATIAQPRVTVTV
jgi:hypothetical protein